MRRTIIVIPCFNEAARLEPESFLAFAEREKSVTLLFIDDGSTDDTFGALDRLADHDRDAFQVHRLDENVGKAEAVRQGLLRAFEAAPDSVGFWDADLATPLSDILVFRELLDARPDLEMIFGSRINLLGRSVKRNLSRHYIGRFFATAVATVLGLAIYDTQCGAKLFRVNDQTRELFADPFVSSWIFDVEIVARLLKQRRGMDLPQPEDVVFEQPLMVWRDVAGSKIRTRDFIIAARDLIRIRSRYLRGLPRGAS